MNRLQIACIDPTHEVDAVYSDQLLGFLILNHVWFEVKHDGGNRQFYVHCSEDRLTWIIRQTELFWQRAENATKQHGEHITPHVFNSCPACQLNWKGQVS